MKIFSKTHLENLKKIIVYQGYFYFYPSLGEIISVVITEKLD
jgi:hypothetical protein